MHLCDIHSSLLSFFSILSVIFIFIFPKSQIVTLNITIFNSIQKVVLLAFKPLLHTPFLWKERKINSIIAMMIKMKGFLIIITKAQRN